VIVGQIQQLPELPKESAVHSDLPSATKSLAELKPKVKDFIMSTKSASTQHGQRVQTPDSSEVVSPLSGSDGKRSHEGTQQRAAEPEDGGYSIDEKEAAQPSGPPAGTPGMPGGPPPNGGTKAWLQVLGGFFLFFNTWVCASYNCRRH
jgi:hypothetical protein